MSTSNASSTALNKSQASSGLTQRELAEAAGFAYTPTASQSNDKRPSDPLANNNAVLSNLVFWQEN
jgi:hypothetical protein